MARLLITGGAGFIGGNFVHYWAANHPDDEVVVLDSLTYAGNRATISGIEQAELVVGNICDTELVERLLRERDISTIVHFAAESHVDRSIAGPDAFIETNVTGTHSLLKAARRAWLDSGDGRSHRFHHISTDEVFGSLAEDEAPFHEESLYAPNSPYAASKAASDHLVRSYYRTFGLEVTTSNCSNNYGPYQYPEKLIPLVLVNALNGDLLPIYGDGLNVRDWLHVEDHCRGIEACLRQGSPGETYNLGGEAEKTNLEVVDTICSTLDKLFEGGEVLTMRFPQALPASGRSASECKRFVDDRPGHDRRYAIDSSKAQRDIGFSPQIPFADGIASTIDWYLQNEEWWMPLRKR